MNIAFDAALAASAVPVARWLAGVSPAASVWSAMAASAACLLLAGVPFRLATQYWRFSGLSDMAGVAGAAALTAALFAALPGTTVDVAQGVVFGLTLLVLLAAPRAGYRAWAARVPRDRGGAETAACWAVGDAEDADLFAVALETHRRPDPALPDLAVTAVLSLAGRQAGRRLKGVPILGTVAEAGAMLARARAEGTAPALIVVVSDMPGAALSALLAVAGASNIPVRRAARPAALTGPAVLRPVAIEELLNRPQVALDRDGMARLIFGARVIVTGAGGSIGSELARQVAALGPERLVLLDNGEFALWQIDLELSERFPGVERAKVLADVRDAARIGAIFAREKPALVFHAAALKHVPMVEDNPTEGLLTNAYGTRVVADAARVAGARAMVLISTDKAVNPTSVMGASKRLAEMYAQALDAQGDRLRCVTVRFGNVLGSTGSVVPLFARQLAAGGPLTVTHPDMQRYFMTVREAVGLVLQASLVGIGAEASEGGIFVLDMGEPVKIVDLARQMIRLAGLRPDVDVPVVFTGPRPGEKLFEELFHGREAPVPTGYPGLLMARPRVADAQFSARAIEEIAGFCRAGNATAALAALARVVPEFRRERTGAAGGECMSEAIQFLDLKAQQRRLGDDLRKRVDAVFAHCAFVMGPEVAELESKLAAFCGAAHCVAVSSGTDALQIAMMAEGIGRGDAVFLPAFTYTATAEVPLVLGATPVFVDIDPRTFQIDCAHLAERIARVRREGKLRARAIVGVDLFGQPADWPRLREIAAANEMFLLDDCAQSFGAALDGAMLGAEADATAISFFPSKPLGAYGDGGALFTESAERAALYRSLRTHGEGTTRYEVLHTGMNGRLDTLQAAVLLSKLTVFSDELRVRGEIAARYDAGLAGAVTIPARVAGGRPAWAIYAILLRDQAARDAMQAALKGEGVPTAIYYPRPLHHQPAYRNHHDGAALPVSEDVATRVLCLPIHPDLTEAQQGRVIGAVRRAA